MLIDVESLIYLLLFSINKNHRILILNTKLAHSQRFLSMSTSVFGLCQKPRIYASGILLGGELHPLYLPDIDLI